MRYISKQAPKVLLHLKIMVLCYVWLCPVVSEGDSSDHGIDTRKGQPCVSNVFGGAASVVQRMLAVVPRMDAITQPSLELLYPGSLPHTALGS